MNADLAGCLKNIDRSYKIFEMDGKPMSKNDVRKVLTYGLKKGYETLKELSEEDINEALK